MSQQELDCYQKLMGSLDFTTMEGQKKVIEIIDSVNGRILMDFPDITKMLSNGVISPDIYREWKKQLKAIKKDLK